MANRNVPQPDGQPEPDGQSGIIEHMLERAGLQGNVDNRLYPVVLDVGHAKDTESAFRISDRDGCIPTSEEFWTLVDYVARFYHVYSDVEIEDYNKRVRARDSARGAESHKESLKVLRQPQEGYVYLLAAGGFHKIGRAKDPRKRTETLAIQLPYQTELVFAVKSDDYVALEAELHTIFAGKRKNGEWFELSDEDLEYIKGRGE